MPYHLEVENQLWYNQRSGQPLLGRELLLLCKLHELQRTLALGELPHYQGPMLVSLGGVSTASKVWGGPGGGIWVELTPLTSRQLLPHHDDQQHQLLALQVHLNRILFSRSNFCQPGGRTFGQAWLKYSRINCSNKSSRDIWSSKWLQLLEKHVTTLAALLDH